MWDLMVPPPSLRLFSRCFSSTTAGSPAHHPYETPFLQWSGPHLLIHLLHCYDSPLGSGAVTPSQQILFFLLPAMRHPRDSKWCELGRSARPRMYVRPATANRTRSRADANMEHAHPRMRTWYPQLTACPWIPDLLVYFLLPFLPSPSLPSLIRRTSRGLLSTPLTSGRLLCWSCATLLLWHPLLCSRASHLQDRLYFFDSRCSSEAPTLQDRTQLHWRVVSLADLRNVSTRHSDTETHDVTSGHYIAYFPETQKRYEVDDTDVRSRTSLSTTHVLFLQIADVGENRHEILA